mmetsp:Transcript_97395/g.203300  ORF Transcript_97395/g.203300 Transcript_97395/m.203300 type:complete len:90 (-) Transcript_97395:122-391(-)
MTKSEKDGSLRKGICLQMAVSNDETECESVGLQLWTAVNGHMQSRNQLRWKLAQTKLCNACTSAGQDGGKCLQHRQKDKNVVVQTQIRN